MGLIKKGHAHYGFMYAPPAGLEPATWWLTATRSTD